MKLWKMLSGVALAVAMVGCTPADQSSVKGDKTVQAEELQVTGSVFYRQRIALPAEAVVTIKLEDVSRADAPSVEISKVSFVTAGKQVPFDFVLPYRAEDVKGMARINVSARIELNGKLLFISDTAHEVITNNRGNQANVNLVQVK